MLPIRLTIVHQSVITFLPLRTAQLTITDASGTTLNTYSIPQTGPGKQIIPGSGLTSGIYQYSLFVDGKIIDTRKMILSKQ
jgi:hypothetical protein